MRHAWTVADHRERLSAPPSWWAAAVGFAITWGWIMLVVIGPVAAVIAFLVALAAVGALVVGYGAVTVAADGTGLQAAHAHLGPADIGEVEILDREQYRRRLGVDADHRAYLCTRPYIERGVLVTVADPADPTPYWLISSRRPDELATALNTHRTTHEGTTRGIEDEEVR